MGYGPFGAGKTFVSCLRNFPFFLSLEDTATFAKLSRNFLAQTEPVAAQKVSSGIECVIHFGGVFIFCVVLKQNPDF